MGKMKNILIQPLDNRENFKQDRNIVKELPKVELTEEFLIQLQHIVSSFSKVSKQD